MYKCENGCEIDYVLICGGDFGKDASENSNTYFRTKLNGTYTDIYADGSKGVPAECHEHADGGCCDEPVCPVCKSICVLEK